MSLEARVTELQNEANSLRAQVVELKEVLETELSRMRAEIQAQLSEARQLLLTRESESMARVAELEAEVVNLTRVCGRALHNENLLNDLPFGSAPKETHAATHVSVPPGVERRDQSSSREKDSFSREPALSIQLSAAVDPVGPLDAHGVHFAIADLRGRLDDVFNFYTADSAVNVALLRPEMHLSHFTKLMGDLGRSTALHRLPPHLLWMDIMRSLPSASTRHRPARRTGSTLLHPPIFQDAESRARQKDTFAQTRLQTLSREQFGEALYIAYSAAAAASRLRNPPVSAQQFRMFLVDCFLPAAEQQMRPQPTSQAARPPVAVASSGVSSTATSMESSIALSASSAGPRSCEAFPFEAAVARYAADDAAQHVLREFAPKLKLAFREAVGVATGGPGCPPHARPKYIRMSLEAFAECIRRHNLLPLVTKTQLKMVFLHCLSTQSHEHLAIDDNCIGYASFVSGMYCLAELVYGSTPALQQQYPSPRARLSKLFVKMLVL